MSTMASISTALGGKKKDAGGGDGRFFTTTKKGEVRLSCSNHFHLD